MVSRLLISRSLKSHFAEINVLSERFGNNDCPVRDRILVERNADTCMARELPTVFHVIDNASRENLGGYYDSTNILSLTGHFH
ncbi:MAG: hypothetical protein LBS69_04305 [Prevotellaceae bacterium]|jgi:hypothetical protein|nr:hypothetical protein [Prevotellaceae bacterium]